MSIVPTFDETVLAVFLHDIGKFAQRAHPGSQVLPSEVRSLESIVLPTREGGRYSHHHVLWTEYFFWWLNREGLAFPGGVNLDRISRLAAYHHRPDTPMAWLVAVSDRLAAGMDRKPRDEETEADPAPRSWEALVRSPLESPFAAVDLGRGPLNKSYLPLGELTPGPDIVPQERLDTATWRERYASLWEAFLSETRTLCGMASLPLFCDALLSVSERFLYAVPSSVKDQPDISLHDHARAAAAIAAALYRWHERRDNLGDEKSIRDVEIPKFRLLTGDLSGIQNSLFLLANQQVRGVSRILRARSFLLGMLAEGAALLCRRAFDLPVFSLIQNAGGQFVLLIADTPHVEEKLDGVRRSIEPWLFRRYFGELSLNLSLTPPFPGRDFHRENFPALQGLLRSSLAAGKLNAFGTCLRAVHSEVSYQHGSCAACGVRPAAVEETADDGVTFWRCEACNDEHRIGGLLPRLAAFGWSEEEPCDAGAALAMFDGALWLACYETLPQSPRALSLARVWRGRRTAGGPLPLRLMANHVPVLSEASIADPRYRDLPEAAESRSGFIKTFQHLAQDALEPVEDTFAGEPLLAVLKADVDDLGLIFSRGLGVPSLSRLASLSRMLDFFFAGQLCEMLERRFPDTYTVYAGGDDLLLIGPWRQMIQLAVELRREFSRWTGANPNLTLSAGVELMKLSHPLNRVAAAAEERLERSKSVREKDRVCAIDRNPVSWPEFEQQLAHGEKLCNWLRDGTLSQAFLYRVLSFDADRRKAEGANGERKLDLNSASWRARWGYQLARNIRDNKRLGDERIRTEAVQELNSLLGLDAALAPSGGSGSCRTAVSVALYRNRSSNERSK